jgi:hypothetical protein
MRVLTGAAGAAMSSSQTDGSATGNDARPLGLNDFVANGIANQFGSRVQLQFVVGVGPMRLHRLHAEIEDGSDLLVAVTLGNQLHYRTFTCGEGAIIGLGQKDCSNVSETIPVKNGLCSATVSTAVMSRRLASDLRR